MARWYLDTSSAFKLLAIEPESAALNARIDTEHPELVSSALLETELRRAAHRVPELTQSDVTRVLTAVTIHDLSTAVYRDAGLIPGTHLRSLDAIHVAAAQAIGVEYLLSYDRRMAEAAAVVGVPTLAPR